jgi:hypothetical protein
MSSAQTTILAGQRVDLLKNKLEGILSMVQDENIINIQNKWRRDKRLFGILMCKIEELVKDHPKNLEIRRIILQMGYIILDY